MNYEKIKNEIKEFVEERDWEHMVGRAVLKN